MAALLDLMREHVRFAVPGLLRQAEACGPAWQRELDELLDRLYPAPAERLAAARAYGRFTIDAMRRQRRFERCGRYEPRPPAGALDERARRDDYLPGLLLSHYLWPQQARQLAFYRQEFLPRLAAAGARRLLEVGIGTGLYTRHALLALPRLQALGVDLSAAALDFSRMHVAAYGLTARFDGARLDLAQADLPQLHDALVCVEVLEHLDAPAAFLLALARQVRPNAYIFVSAALNAADVDHVHRYGSPDEVLAQVEAAGFRVEASLLAEGRTSGAPGVPVPAVLALIMRPQELQL
jgi:SAM-dependent methyltransferase